MNRQGTEGPEINSNNYQKYSFYGSLTTHVCSPQHWDDAASLELALLSTFSETNSDCLLIVNKLTTNRNFLYSIIAKKGIFYDVLALKYTSTVSSTQPALFHEKALVVSLIHHTSRQLR